MVGVRRLVEVPWIDARNLTATPKVGCRAYGIPYLHSLVRSAAAGDSHLSSSAPKRELQPRERIWLHRLPPYVRHLDLSQEMIVVSNPDSRPLVLTGYYLMDRVSGSQWCPISFPFSHHV
jgi:hypothetical protein